MIERPVPNIPSDKLLAEVLHKCPEKIFKYHEHDSLLEKEADLTEEEKENAWKRYEQEAKKHEIESQLKMSQETPPFPDSEPKFSEFDRLLDEFNGNIPSKPPIDNPSTLSGLSPGFPVCGFSDIYSTNKVVNANEIALPPSAFSPLSRAGKFRTNNSIQQTLQFLNFPTFFRFSSET